MLERFLETSPFVVVIKAALAEARRRGERRVGTEHLFLGLLHDATSARALGADLPAARAALDDLDGESLHRLGIDVADVDLLAELPREHPPLTLGAMTSGARDVVRRAIEATTLRSRNGAPRHLLRALLERAPPDPVTALIEQLGIDRARAVAASS